MHMKSFNPFPKTKKAVRFFLMIIPVLFLAQSSEAQVPFEKIGEIRPRDATEIEASPWSVGAETMGRGYIIYDNWKEYLGPLGVKKARIQSGWARTEKEKGVYDWSWMDKIIPDMVSRGVTPWVDICYGNSIYAGGGGTKLREKSMIPNSGESLRAWKLYVRELVARYKDHVNEWEVWNEPNGGADPVEYANLLILTAETVKEIQPEAKILGLALGSGVDYKYADKVLAEVARRDRIYLIDQITHHRHIPIPEENHNEIMLEKIMDKYSKKLVARQGEAGCPSEYSESFALQKMPWSELTQAKHVLRRMMTDFGRNKETSVFLIMDAKYKGRPWNRKGLLRSDENQQVEKIKQAYYAVQHVTSVFDSTVVSIPDYPWECNNERPVSLYGIENVYSGKQMVAVWFDDRIPSENNHATLLDFTFLRGNFDHPVYADLRTGEVYDIPDRNLSKQGSVYTFKNIPVYDSPVLIAEKELIRLKSQNP